MRDSTANAAFPIIAGSGRSGTTWVLDVLAEANGLRPVFEPLFPQIGAIARKYQCTYVEPSSDASDLREYLNKMVTNSDTNSFVDYRISPENLRFGLHRVSSWQSSREYLQTLRKFVRRRLEFRQALREKSAIIKLIRANWLLPWLVRQLSNRATLIVRHPGAVADSQHRAIAHWTPDDRINRYMEDDYIRRTYSSQLGALNLGELSNFAKLVLIWCIENVEPLRLQNEFGYAAVFYEDLKHGFPDTWYPLLSALGLENMPTESAVIRPSQQSSSRWRANIDGNSAGRTRHWRERMGEGRMSELEEVLGAFGIDFYACESGLPDKAKYVAWLKKSRGCDVRGQEGC